MRPDVICDIKGVPVGHDVVGPETGAERDCALELAAGHPGTWFADKDFWGREYDACLQLVGVGLITLNKHRPGRRSRSELAKAASGSCESVFSTLKRQTRLEIHLAKTLPGLSARITQRLFALTIGIYLNTLLGRPARALAAYDGR
jgi:hypothetical protein